MEIVLTNFHDNVVDHKGGENFILDVPKLVFQTKKVNYILGRNGSGKSLLLGLICGIRKSSITQPVISFDGVVSRPGIDTSLVYQRAEDNLCLDLTVEENSLLRIKANSFSERLFPKKLLRNKVRQALGAMPKFLKKGKQLLSTCSGGEKQQIAFMLSLISHPKLFCLDEFLSSVDFEASLMFRAKLKSYAVERDACVLVVSHELQHAVDDADTITILSNGKNVLEISRDSINWNVPFIEKFISEHH